MASGKPPAEELTVGDRTVRVTNPDKVYFPQRGLTKRDVVNYYLSVGDGILGALHDRPTSLERWPNGVIEGAVMASRSDPRGDAFYQKRVPQGAPDYVVTATVTFPSGRTADEVCPTELAVVAWAANLGTITFHPWPARKSDTDHPDQLRIDLDPQPGTDFSDAARVAPVVRELLGEFGMEAFPKTSGGRGLHLFVPIVAEWTFVQARRAVIAVGREVERRMPEHVTMSWWKEERGKRIFIDFNQMARDRTMASAYSIRPNQRATVSAPLQWDELESVQPNDFDVTTMPSRYAEKGDLHAGLQHAAYRIEALLELSERDERDRGLGDMPYPPEYPKMPGEPMRVQPSRAKRVTSDEASS
jgi:DNA ligase D